ncbi:MAG: 50S ribosomal protein L3 [Armatimonadota bacterium]|nr:50S ribosomal protein L3 [Armatimonadota bacterium]MDW8103560.1 50S ribosomal protein L3 [Armatimonadota bacterium]
MAVQAILGKKIGMTQVFDETGRAIPVSVIQAGPCVVTQVKTPEKDGYVAVQVGFEQIPPKRVNKPMRGHFKKANVPPMRYLREVPVDDLGDLAVGTEIRVSDVFKPGDKVKVTGVSKGRGFQGVVKRHHFHGGPQTHGSMIHRKPQSSGATDPARTFKGVKKPGHMGAQRVTQRGLTVVRVDAERNLLLVRGAVPGANGGLLTIAKEQRG